MVDDEHLVADDGSSVNFLELGAEFSRRKGTPGRTAQKRLMQLPSQPNPCCDSEVFAAIVYAVHDFNNPLRD